MIDSVTNATNLTAASGSPDLTGGVEKEMGREEFLKLLVAQLQNQDPLKPQDNAQFVAELATFSNLEQTMGINDRLDALSAQNQGLQNSQVVSMVGKTATVRGSMVTANGSGTPVPVNFELLGDAEQLSITLADLNGKKVRTVDIGARSAGQVAINWDGKTDTGLIAPKGTYTVTINAKSAAGGNVASTQETSGIVDAVSFDKGYPVLKLSNGVQVPISDLLKVEE
jgi:flagellar basal-body rod modification protein FlgD